MSSPPLARIDGALAARGREAAMQRRHLLVLGGLAVSLSGCLGSSGSDGEGPPDEVTVSVTDRADQPAIPVEYDVELVTSVATVDRPARLRVTITNPTEDRVVLGEERAVKFHHATSDDAALYLHPAGEETWTGPVEPGCWRLTDFVAVPEYYGTVPIGAGETVAADSYVYGHPDLPDGACLPTGEHRVRTTGVAGADEEAVLDEANATEFEWGFTLQVGE